MRIAIKATNLDLTPAVKKYAEEKIGNLEKYLDNAIEAKVELERDRKHNTGAVFRAEVMIVLHGKVLRAEERSEDMYASIDMIVPKLREQISKLKDRKSTLIKRGARKAKGKF